MTWSRSGKGNMFFNEDGFNVGVARMKDLTSFYFWITGQNTKLTKFHVGNSEVEAQRIAESYFQKFKNLN